MIKIDQCFLELLIRSYLRHNLAMHEVFVSFVQDFLNIFVNQVFLKCFA